MGGLSEGKRGCFCPENIFVKSLIDHLVLDRDEIVILDMEAGVEHLTRGTASGVDMSLVVVEPERRSVQTGLKISSLCKEIGIPRVFFICNKIRTQEDKAFLTSVVTEEDILCFVPFDEELTSLSRGEGSPYDSASLRAWASENAKKIRVFMERGAT
jgi:CO dehydrogenase maturation factor